VTDPARFFATWRRQSLAGSRDVIDGLLREEHLGPSAELAASLAEWPGAWYWGDDEHRRLVLVRGAAPARPERWLWHGALFLFTIITTLAAGAVLTRVLHPPTGGGLSGLVAGVFQFAEFVAQGGWRELLPGWTFAGPLLGILLVHELGHYVAARRYAIDVSPPYFLPIPPNVTPIGTLGAFLRIRSPVYDRRQLLDVGAAGPLAGFVVALGVLWWGYTLSVRLPPPFPQAASFILIADQPVLLGESLITGWLRDLLVPGTGGVLLSPQAFAGWVGMFVTALNLLPLSQLDGGHVLHGLIGRRQAAVSLVAGLGLVWLGQFAAMWWAWAALTFVIGGGGWSHPAVVLPDRPVLQAGRLVGVACIVIFVATFVPVPFGG
jgi:membrane-associated protease RseP (regulator of RpoE activity)